MKHRRIIPSSYVSTTDNGLLQAPMGSDLRIPNLCVLSAASYSQKMRSSHLLDHTYAPGVQSDRRSLLESDTNRQRIKALSCLILKHQREFEALKLPLLPALKGERLVVEPSWELDQQRRLSLIQILHLLSNMVSRREYLSSSLIRSGFTAALQIFESLDLEKTSKHYIN